MFTYEFVMAAALITAPADAIAPEDMRAWHGPLRASIVHVAIQAEILDLREEPFHMTKEESFGDDVRLLQSRFEEFQNTPLLDEIQRFPDRKLVSDFLAFNRAYRSDLRARLIIDLVHAEDLRHAIQETDQLHQIWDCLRDARCEYYYVTVRRQALGTLRHLIGDTAFYSAQMPPHVPVWRFTGN